MLECEEEYVVTAVERLKKIIKEKRRQEFTSNGGRGGARYARGGQVG